MKSSKYLLGAISHAKKAIVALCVLSLFTAFPSTATEGQESTEQGLEERVKALEENRLFDRIAIHGVLAGAYQGETANGPDDAKSFGRGAVTLQPEISITLTEQDEIVFEFGFPAGDGLNDVSQMLIVPWAANLEGNVRNINGRNRDYLLTAWYKHTFVLGDGHIVGVTGGIIDATTFLDQNTYANDEFSQFLNPALVNGPNGFAPSFDLGGAITWGVGNFYLNVVVMNIGENESGVNYTFYGSEVGYTLETGLGKGNFRLAYEGGRKAFLDPTGATLEDRNLVFLSCDQQFGENFGAWIRFGWGDDNSALDAADLYSGGIDIGGSLWGRSGDNIGLGVAFFHEGNTRIESITVGELYYRFAMNEWLTLTIDLQYQDNRYENTEAGSGIHAWTYGLRAVVAY